MYEAHVCVCEYDQHYETTVTPRNEANRYLNTKAAICGLHDFDPARLDCTNQWQVVMTGRHTDASLLRGVRVLDEGAVYDAGMRYEDRVAAVGSS